jgi:hypothetical protein
VWAVSVARIAPLEEGFPFDPLEGADAPFGPVAVRSCNGLLRASLVIVRGV